MNILFDHQIFCMQEYGGISRYFFELAQHIAEDKQNHSEIFAFLYINQYLAQTHSFAHEGIKVKKARIIAGPFVLLSLNNLLAKYLVKRRRDIDILHETYYSYTNYRPRSAKRIITVFDMIHEKFADSFPPSDKTTAIKAHSVNKADHVICISTNTQKDLIHYYNIPVNKTSVIHLGYSLGEKIGLCPIDARDNYILFVGRRDGYKNFSGVLRAYSQSNLLRNNFSLICFGGGPFSPAERQLIQSLDLTSNITHRSGDDHALAKLYQRARAFVYPSRYEGFGIPLLEAMSSGCPVVCSNTSALPEIAGNAAEFFDPENIKDIQETIERVVLSPDISLALIDKGFERIKLFSWKKCAEHTAAVYNRVLEG